jgi:hypothetical protein
MAGRPAKEFDRKTFVDLVGLNCDEKEICWFFRDNEGKPANVDTLSRWCVRTFGVNFQEYCKQNRGLALRIKLRQAQMKLAEKSAAMAIFLGKNMLGQTDKQEITTSNIDERTRSEVNSLVEAINNYGADEGESS